MPHNPLPSHLLENVLCGVAFGLGVLGILVGLVLIIHFRKPCSGGTLGAGGLAALPGFSWAWGGLRVALGPLGGGAVSAPWAPPAWGPGYTEGWGSQGWLSGAEE